MARWLRRFDFFREIDRDLVQTTNIGAIVSICCMLTVLYLLIAEYQHFQTISVESKVHVNTPHHYEFDALVPIFINLSIPNVACPIFAVDVSDAMGRFSFHLDPSKVLMYRLGYASHVMDRMSTAPSSVKFYNQNDIIQRSRQTFISESDIKNIINEGCRIEARLDIKNIPGNIHFSGHAHDDLVDIWVKHASRKSIDLSHVIHQFEIGNQSVNDFLVRRTMRTHDALHEYASFFPLNGFQSITPPSFVAQLEKEMQSGDEYERKQHSGHSHLDNTIQISYEYFMKIVSSKYRLLSGEVISQGYQFTVASHVNEQLYQTPVINFRYNPSALTVEYVENKPTFSHFIVQILAIVAGVYVCCLAVNAVVRSGAMMMDIDKKRL